MTAFLLWLYSHMKPTTPNTTRFWRVVWSAGSGHCAQIFTQIFFFFWFTAITLFCLSTRCFPVSWSGFLFVADQCCAPDAALRVDESHLTSIMLMQHLTSYPPMYCPHPSSSSSGVFFIPFPRRSASSRQSRSWCICAREKKMTVASYWRGAEIDVKCLSNILTHSSQTLLFDLSPSWCSWRRSAFQVSWCINNLGACAKNSLISTS